MFDSYGQVATPSRIESYLDVIGDFPIDVYTEGIRDAMQVAGDFPPGPGNVHRAIVAAAARARAGSMSSGQLAPGLRLVPWQDAPAKAASGIDTTEDVF